VFVIGFGLAAFLGSIVVALTLGWLLVSLSPPKEDLKIQQLDEIGGSR